MDYSPAIGEIMATWTRGNGLVNIPVPWSIWVLRTRIPWPGPVHYSGQFTIKFPETEAKGLCWGGRFFKCKSAGKFRRKFKTHTTKRTCWRFEFDEFFQHLCAADHWNWRFAMIASFCTASCAKYLRQFSCPSGPDRPNPSWGSGGEIIIDSKGSHFFMGYVLISQEGMFMSHPELKTTEIISGPAMFSSPAQKGTNTFKSRCLTWFRYRVSIHHPFRVLIGTPTWRCWDMLSCKPCARVSKN